MIFKRILALILIYIFCSAITYYIIKEENKIEITELNSNLLTWGIITNNNEKQPELTLLSKQELDKVQGIGLGNSNKEVVYLTFDEGYEAGNTNKILDVLKKNNVKAAFFITNNYLKTSPELIKRMINEGHIVGNHTMNHYNLSELTEDNIKQEIMQLDNAVYEIFGYKMKYIRPPMGKFSQKSLVVTKSIGYTTVMWSFAYDDWNEHKQDREEYAKRKILDNIHNGAVILLHANSKDNSNVLDFCIKEIKNRGYDFKTLDEFNL